MYARCDIIRLHIYIDIGFNGSGLPVAWHFLARLLVALQQFAIFPADIASSGSLQQIAGSFPAQLFKGSTFIMLTFSFLTSIMKKFSSYNQIHFHSDPLLS